MAKGGNYFALDSQGSPSWKSDLVRQSWPCDEGRDGKEYLRQGEQHLQRE